MSVILVDLGAAPAGAATTLAVLAQPAPPPGKGEEFGKASPVGLVVVLLLAVATVFLIRSMSKRIRRLPASFDPPGPDDGAQQPEGRPAQPAARGDADEAGSGRS